MTEFSGRLKSERSKPKAIMGMGKAGPERPAGSKHAFLKARSGCQLGQAFGRSAVAQPPVRLVSLNGHMNVRPQPNFEDRSFLAMWRARMRLIIIALAFVLVVAFLASRNTHVAPNPGPGETPGSTALDGKPPPAEGPSGTTTGTAR
jgi:hypothetical protein